jgi:hypothetical protein
MEGEMSEDGVDRKQFLAMLGRAGIGTCMCAAAVSAHAAAAGEDGPAQAKKPATAPETKPGEVSVARAAKRMEFVDIWVPRFFSVMDAELDEPTRKRVMAANGKACFIGFRPDLKPRATPATREEMAAWVAKRGAASGYSMEGDTIVMKYMGSAETGQASPSRVCLCPTAEAQAPKKISATFCWCSVGYVKEMHERVFGRPVKVELAESVLMGHDRCTFRITV